MRGFPLAAEAMETVGRTGRGEVTIRKGRRHTVLKCPISLVVGPEAPYFGRGPAKFWILLFQNCFKQSQTLKLDDREFEPQQKYFFLSPLSEHKDLLTLRVRALSGGFHVLAF